MKYILKAAALITIIAMLSALTVGAASVAGPFPKAKFPNAAENTPAENVFMVPGNSNEFILLDENFNDSAASFFIMIKGSFGREMFYPDNSDSGRWKFDVNNSSSISAKLNTNANHQKLGSVFAYVDTAHSWPTEGSLTTPADYMATGALALLSYTEYQSYQTKVGYNDGLNEQWWLRTASGASSARALCVLPKIIDSVAAGSIEDRNTGNPRQMRPVFWINDAFFKNVKINLLTAGENVLASVRNNYTADELKGTYTNDELLTMGYTAAEIGTDVASVSFRDTDDFGIIDVSDAGLNIEIHNGSAVSQKSFTIDWEIHYIDTWTRENVRSYTLFDSGSETAEVDADNFVIKPVEFANPPKGIVKIKVKVKDGNTVITDSEKELCYIDTYERQFLDEYSTFAANSSVTSPEWESEALIKAGILTKRIEIGWDSSERVKGQYDFSRAAGGMGWLEQHGVDTYLILDYSNELYCPTPEVTDTTLIRRPKNFYGPRTQEQVQAFCNYAVEVLSAYPQISMVEIYNEPNFSYWQPTGDNGRYAMPDYANFVKAVSMAVKSVRPDIEVVGGAFGNGGSYTAMNCQPELMNEGIAPFVTGMSTHPYYSNDSNVRVDTGHYGNINSYVGGLTWISGTFFENVVNNKDAFLDKYESEIGITTGTSEGSIDYKLQAEEVAKIFIYGQAYERKKTIYYCFRDPGTDLSYGEHNYGILLNDGRPKASYAAVSQAANVLGGAFYQGELDFSDDRVRAYLYEKDGEPVIVAWTTIETTSQQEYLKNINLPNRLSEDLYGNPIENMNTTVTLGQAPIYIYGVSDDFYSNTAVFEAVKSCDKLLGYEWLPNDIKTDLQSLKILTESQNPSGSTVMNAVKAIGRKIIMADLENDKKLLALWDTANIGKAWSKLLAREESGYIKNISILSSAAARLNGKADAANELGEVNPKFAVSDELLRNAKRHAEIAEFVENPAYYPENLSKTAVIDYNNRVSEMLAGWLLESEDEADIYSSVLIFTDFRQLPYENKINLRRGFPEKFEITVDNTRRTEALTDIIPIIVDDNGNELTRGAAFNVPAGETSGSMSFTISAPNNMTREKHIFRILLTKNGNVINQRGIPVNAELNVQAADMKVLDASVVNSPAENLFTVDGQKFILLDDTEDGLFVMPQKQYGTHMFSPITNNRGSQAFDLAVNDSLAKYLNNDVKALLPESIRSNIVTHDWKTEMAHDGGSAPNPYTVTADIAPLSYMEWRDYHKKIGYNDGDNTDFWLRTGPGTNKSPNLARVHLSALIVSGENGEVNYREIDTVQGVRPAFYLSRNFFSSYKIDIAAMGESVKRSLLGSNPADLAEAGYTAAELRALGFPDMTKTYEKNGNDIYAGVTILSGGGISDISQIQLILSSYDVSLLDNIWTKTPLQIGSTGVYKAEIAVQNTNDTHFRAFLWKSITSMMPLEDAYDY